MCIRNARQNRRREGTGRAFDDVNRASDKFDRRYRAVEAKLAAEGKTVDDTPMDRLDELWNEVKADEKN